MTHTRIAIGLALTLLPLLSARCVARESDAIPGGELRIVAPDGVGEGICPLRHTDVQADIVGFVSRVRVRQVFYNPLAEKIEAVYVFPLPQDAAVDDMVMTVGDRRIVGQIKSRDDARKTYETARAQGHVASLLDQERPNIFTQSVTNIEPGVEVRIEISYVETLKYDGGEFQFVFPMVVGPRYIPGGGSAPAPMSTGQPTPQVPDAHRITPPVVPPGLRAGHDISLTVSIDAGMPIANLDSELHQVKVERAGDSRAVVTLANLAEIPNKDFILHYRTDSRGVGDALFTHTDARGTFFTLFLQPPQRVAPEAIVPREVIFVLDTSGSMRGFPIDKAKDVMRQTIDSMRAGDTFNLITFAGRTQILWNEPRPNTPGNRAEAKAFLASRRGSGGTEMMQAINAALARGESGPNQPIRIVCFMTDGYVGNDMAIIDAVRKNADTTRVFSFGIGNSVNRFLLDGMASAGRGEVEYVSLQSDADAAIRRFSERISAPVLTDIAIDWGSLRVADVHPKRIPDLFSSNPVMVHGRLQGPPSGTITLRGTTGAGPFERAVQMTPPQGQTHDALASLWARAKAADLIMSDYAGLQSGGVSESLRNEITTLGIEYRLMTQFTSFVAVEEMTVTVAGRPTKINVPVEMSDGVSYQGVFGQAGVRVGGFVQAAAGTRMYDMASVRSKSGFAGVMSRLQAAPTPPPQPKPAVMTTDRVLTAQNEYRERRRDADHINKLAAALRGLAQRVETDGTNGSLTLGKLQVIAHKVDVRLYLRDLSSATLQALKDAGFVKTGESKSVRMLVGTIDVRKLAELAKLHAVLRVTPVRDDS